MGSVVQGTVCLHGPDTLPTDAEMNSTYHFAFPNGTGSTYKDSTGNDITLPPGRCGAKQVSQFGKELPAPNTSLWPGWTGQGPCTMDVDAHHKENHAMAFTAVINPDWIQPGLHITIQAGAAQELAHEIRVNPESHVTMLNVDQIMFGFRSAYTLQHQDLMKQWMGIYLSATKVSLTTGVVNVDFGASKDGPLTRSSRTSNQEWGGFSGLIQNSMGIASLAKKGFGMRTALGRYVCFVFCVWYR